MIITNTTGRRLAGWNRVVPVTLTEIHNVRLDRKKIFFLVFFGAQLYVKARKLRRYHWLS